MDDLIRDQFEADAEALHADFGEPVLYRRGSDPDNPIITTALVERDALSTSPGDRQRTVRTPIEAELLRSAVEAIDTTRDQIRIAEREGGTPRWYPVAALIAHDEVQWRIAINR